MKIIRFFVIFHALSLLVQPVISQPKGMSKQHMVFRHLMSENITLEKGLSQNSIYSIAEDSRGLIWIGTWDGLNRYDGYTFKIYNKENGLTNETIRTLLRSGNNLWIGTENGLTLLNTETNVMTSFLSDEYDTTSLTNNWINHIYEDHQGKIWISTINGLNEYLPQSQHFRQYFSSNYSNPLRSNHYNMISQNSQNKYWVATNYGLVYYEISTGRISRYFHKPDDTTSLPDNQVNKVTIDHSGFVWVGTKKGLAFLDPATGVFHRHYHNINLTEVVGEVEIRSLLYETGKGIWIGTGGYGLFFLDENNKTFLHYKRDNNKLYSISDNRIQHIFIDKNGIVWVGTFSGINILNRNAPVFRLYRNMSNKKDAPPGNAVWDFTETEPGVIWIANDDGISIFNKSSGSFTTIKHNPDQPNSLPGNLVRSIFRDSKGMMWIGTRDKGLSSYDIKNNKFTNFLYNETDTLSLSNDYALNITEDNRGNIWVATESGLNRFIPEMNGFKRYFSNKTDESSIAHNHIYDFHIDSTGNLWITTADGLMLYNPDRDNFQTYRLTTDQLESNPSNNNKFLSISEDRQGNFWIGTRGSGLAMFNPVEKQFSLFTEEDELANNLVYGAIQDRQGDLWITTNKGLSRLNPQDFSITNFDVNDGLQSNEFNLNALLCTSDGEIFAGGMNGFNCFYPDDIRLNQKPPSVIITTFKKFNIDQGITLNNGDVIRLQHDDNFFSFEFTALDYRSPLKNKYRYKLENYDEDWIDRGADRRYAEYARVKPGNYVFRLVASNSDGYWNKEGINISIIIAPPWYATWWFRITLLLLILSLAYLLAKIRINALHRKHDHEKKLLSLEKQLYELEQKALQLQMNPHFLFNSLNSIQSFVVNNDIDNAIHYLSKFSQLMRRILSNSGESFIPLNDEIQALQLYLDIEKLRFANKFDYQIYIDPNIDEEFVEIPPMILQPYVENAIIHGLMHKMVKGSLYIGFSLVGENILCVIEDDGIGREKSAELRRQSGIVRKSRGMLITGERLSILNQYSSQRYEVKVIDLKNELGEASGTRVEIILHYKD